MDNFKENKMFWREAKCVRKGGEKGSVHKEQNGEIMMSREEVRSV